MKGTLLSKLIRLSVGEPDFPTPAHIKEAGCRAIAEGFTRYTPQPGFDDLREAIARKLRQENGIDVPASQVVVSCGGKHSLYNAIQCAIGSGDEVIVPQPYWSTTADQVARACGKPVLVPTHEANGFLPAIDDIERALTRRTRAMIFNSPCNPTGSVYPRELLEEIAALAVERDLLVISDEVYEKLLFDGAEHVSIASLNPQIAARTVTVNSVSKTHAMTGWRIGYAAMPPELAQKVITLQSVSTSGPCAIAQRAALAAISGDQSHVREMVVAYAKRRQYLMERVRRIPALGLTMPRGTFYLFVNVSVLVGRTVSGQTIKDANGVVEVALREANVQLLSGAAFGAPQHIRFSFAVSMEEMSEGMDRLEKLLA